MTPPPPANDNQPRPAWFDALLLQYDPLLRKQSRIYAISLDAEDIYQDTIVHVLAGWHCYHDGPDGPFAPWLVFQVLKVVSRLAKQERRAKVTSPTALVTPATQETVVEIGMTVRNLKPFEAESILMQAVGYTAKEAGHLMGRPRNSVCCAIRDGRAVLRAANDDEPVREVA